MKSIDCTAPRYAIYYAPAEESLLFKLGSAWLGRDARTGESLERPSAGNLSKTRMDEITSAPAHYGFHATLKPPFVLKAGTTASELRDSLRSFSASRQPFRISTLKVGSLGRFVAVILSEPSMSFQHLANDSVRTLDSFRAPPSEEELSRRRNVRLTYRQDELLCRWGYPYLFDQWQFHMTLTDPLEHKERQEVQNVLRDILYPSLEVPLTINSICLFEQENRLQPFCLTERFSFACEGAVACP